MNYKQIVLLGDSITEYSSLHPSGLHLYLSKAYVRRLDVVNRGYDGYNTKMLKLALPNIFSSLGSAEQAGFVLFMGTNDAVIPGQLLHVPIDEFRDNMQYIIDQLLKRSKRIVLLTPAIFDKNRFQNRDKDLMAQYVNAVEKLSEKNKLPLVNLQKLFGSNLNLLSDGLHFTDEGYKRFAPQVLEAFKNLHLDPEDMPMKLPDFNDLKGKTDEEIDQLISEYTATYAGIDTLDRIDHLILRDAI